MFMSKWRRSTYRTGPSRQALMHGCPLTASSMIWWIRMLSILALTVSARFVPTDDACAFRRDVQTELFLVIVVA